MNRKPVSSRIHYIYKNHYSEKSASRFDYFVNRAVSFCENITVPKNVLLHVNKTKLRAVVKSYFLDVIKFKEYHFQSSIAESEEFKDADREKLIFSDRWVQGVHDERQLSPSKVGAFTVKWLIKHSAITVIDKNKKPLSEEDAYTVNSINARFSVIVALELMNVDQYIVEHKKKRRLVYHLMYRNFDDRTMFGWMESMIPDTRKNINKSFSVFVASPSDVVPLRKATKQIIEAVNKEYDGGVVKLNSYMWEEDKRVEATDKYQEHVFREATQKWGGNECDIVIMFVWHKFGKGTKEEFDFYIEKFVNNKDKLFVFFRYGARPNLRDVDGASKDLLDTWVGSIEDGIAPLGGKRDAITTPSKYKESLSRALRVYLREQGS